MLFKRVLLSLTALLLATAISASDTGKLPDGILAHVSVNSMGDYVNKIDTYVVECVKGTPFASQYQPGMLPLMVNVLSPVPATAFDIMGNVQIAAVKIGNTNEPAFVFILRTNGTADLKKALEDAGAQAEGEDGNLAVTLPRIPYPLYFANVGNDAVAFSNIKEATDLVVAAASQLALTHNGEADVVINLDIKNILAAYKVQIDAGLAEIKTKAADAAIMASGSDKDLAFANSIRELGMKLIGEVEKQIPTLRNIVIETSINGDLMKSSLWLSADKGSAIDGFRANFDGKGNPEIAFTKALPANTLLASGNVRSADLPKGVINLYADIIKGITQPFMNDQADELATLPEKFLSLGIKESLSAMYISRDLPTYVVYFECEKPDELAVLLPKTADLLQVLCNGLMAKVAGPQPEAGTPNFEVTFVPEKGTIDGKKYSEVSLTLAIEGVSIFSYDALILIDGNTSTMVYGFVQESDLANAINNLKEGKGAFINSAQVQKVLPKITNRQISFAVFKPLDLIVATFMNNASMKGPGILEAVKEIAQNIEPSPNCLAVGSGVNGSAFVVEGVLPASVISDLVRNSEYIREISIITQTTPSSSVEYEDDYASDSEDDDSADQ